MSETVTRKSACILCYVNCGIEVEIEDGLMKRVRGDKDNPKSLGYICQKAGRLPYYANDRALRLTSPLRRTKDGDFEKISWDVAIAEIAAKLHDVRAIGGAQAFGYYGGGGQGSVMGGVFGQALRGVMGSGPYFSAVSQEKTGDFWVNGTCSGRTTFTPPKTSMAPNSPSCSAATRGWPMALCGRATRCRPSARTRTAR